MTVKSEADKATHQKAVGDMSTPLTHDLSTSSDNVLMNKKDPVLDPSFKTLTGLGVREDPQTEFIEDISSNSHAVAQLNRDRKRESGLSNPIPRGLPDVSDFTVRSGTDFSYKGVLDAGELKIADESTFTPPDSNIIDGSSNSRNIDDGDVGFVPYDGTDFNDPDDSITTDVTLLKPVIDDGHNQKSSTAKRFHSSANSQSFRDQHPHFSSRQRRSITTRNKPIHIKVSSYFPLIKRHC